MGGRAGERAEAMESRRACPKHAPALRVIGTPVRSGAATVP
jgi:hypothetical protein